MHDLSAWSVGLGRWNGVRIRIHALFILVGVLALYLASREEDQSLVSYGFVALGILFVSVLLHELAHCIAARYCGGYGELIVIGPLGGLAPVHVPHEPHSELITALMGPMVNLVIWILTLPWLWAAGVDLAGLLNPLRPEAVIEGAPAINVLKLTAWINWCLVLVNLLPAVPLDGGRVLRSILWPIFGYRTAVMWVSRVAIGAAITLWVIAYFMYEAPSESYISPWLPLLLIGMLLFFSGNQERSRIDNQDVNEECFGYDFSQGFTSLEREEPAARREEPSLMRRWLERRREERERVRRDQEAAEERSVDEILARLHSSGIDNLSVEERELLHRVSARYRNRSK